MKLEEFLTTAKACGRTRYRVQSPRGYELAKGELGSLEGVDLVALCTDDAHELVRGKMHEYVLVVENNDGGNMGRFSVRVPGGKDTSADDVPDASMLMTRDGVNANLCKAVIELAKTVRQANADILDERKQMVAQVERSRRAEGKAGRFDVARRKLELDYQERKEENERWGLLWKGLAPMGTALMTRLLPGGKDAGWSAFKEGLRQEQMAKFAEVLGAVRLATLLATSSADKAANFFVDHVTPAEGQVLFEALDEDQRTALGSAIAEQMKKRTENGAAAATPESAAAQ